MVFVLFTLPVVLTGASLVLGAGNKVLDYIESVRGIRAEQKRSQAAGGDPVHVVVEVVTDPATADALLRDPRIVQGRATAEHFRRVGAI